MSVGRGDQATLIAHAGRMRCGVIPRQRCTGAQDGQIAYLYLQANLFEVETAELARARGTDAAVRSSTG